MLLTGCRDRWTGLRVLALAAVLLFGSTLDGAAQEPAVTPVGFVFRFSATPIEATDALPPVLRQPLTLTLRRVTVEHALREIATRARLDLSYSRAIVPLSRIVSVDVEHGTIAEALRQVLHGVAVELWIASNGKAALVPATPEVTSADTGRGAIGGRVTDAKTGEALAGAEVWLEGTRYRAGSGENGYYRVGQVAARGYTLVVRRIGYGRWSRPVTVVAEQEVTVDAALAPVPTNLNEVVVTATGEQRRLELGHVVGRINADSVVREAPVTTVTELLSARVPGLLVQQSQGTVGGVVTLQVRSANSATLSNEPIVLVDGIRYLASADTRRAPTDPFHHERTTRLNDLNPNDIESIEVVKGPSAATLYGTDAANGVIVITTKRGRPGPARWAGYVRADANEIPKIRYPDTWWGWGTGTSSCALLFMAQGGCAVDSVTVVPNPLNDAALTMFGRKPQWEYGLNVSGGSRDLRYYFSAGLVDATGPVELPRVLGDSLRAQQGAGRLPKELLEPNAQTSLNLQSTVSTGLGDRAEVRVSAAYRQSDTRTIDLNANPLVGALLSQPSSPYGGLGPQKVFAKTSTERNNRFSGSALLSWQPRPWLQARGTVGLDLTSATRNSLARPDSTDFATPNGAVADNRSRYVNTTADLGATASFGRGRLSSRTSLGAQYARTLQDVLMTDGTGLPPGGSSIGEATFRSAGRSYRETVTLGTYVEQVVGFNDRLFLTGALRADGGSAFGRDYDVAVYPKASASWLLSEERFMPRLPGLEDLRLRYAFGASGQQPTPEMTQPFYVVGQSFVDGVPGNAVSRASLGNPDLRPERVREHEVGFDATAFQGRAQLEMTWNYRRTLDGIVSEPFPPGHGDRYINVGRLDGHGFETRLTVRPIHTRLVSWSVTVQHAWHTNTVVDLGDATESRTIGGSTVQGYSLNARFSRPILGYNDASGNGIIELDEIQLGDTAVYAGRVTPPRTQTLNTTFGLFQDRLRLSATLDRQSGFVVPDYQLVTQCNLNIRCRAAVDPAASMAEQAVVAALWKGGNEYAPMQPGDFTSLREVSATLELPASLLRVLRCQRATLSVTARNLAKWTAFDGPDPETTASTLIPQARSWALRLDVGF